MGPTVCLGLKKRPGMITILGLWFPFLLTPRSREKITVQVI